MIQRPVVFERFAGRGEELEALVSLRRQSAVESEVACAMVAGEAGFGKSRLLHEFRRRTASDRGKCIVVRCFAGWSEPYASILTALRDMRHGDQPGSAIEEAIAVLRSPDDDDVSAEELARRRREPVAAAIASEAKRRGHLTLVVEDAHWSDIESLEMLRFVVARYSTLAVLIVVTYRPSAIEADFERARAIAALEREGAMRVVLGPISRADQLSLLRAVLPSESEEVVERICELSEGSPFVAEELAFAAANRGLAELPLSLRGSIIERMRDLDASTRGLLSRAAVFGRSVRFEDLLVLGPFDRETALAALRLARNCQILIEDELRGKPVFRFRHALTREVLYGELLALERAEFHRAIGDYIEAGDARERGAEIAYHRWASGDRPAAFGACERAGDEACSLGAHGEAKRNFDRALECASDDAGYARIAGKLLAALRDTDNFEAIRPLCEAVAQRLLPGTEFERGLLLCLYGARVLVGSFRTRDASELFASLIGERGRDGTPEIRFRRLEVLALIERADERIESAQRVLHEARAVFSEPTAAQEAKLLDLHLTVIDLLKHDVEESIAIATLAVERARQSGDFRLEAGALLMLSTFQMKRTMPSAIPTLEAAVALCEAHRDTAKAWRMRANLAAVLMNAGRVLEGSRLIECASRDGFLGPAWAGSQTLAVRMLGWDSGPFVRAMRDPERLIATPWHALVICSHVAYAVSREEAQRMIASAWPLIAHPGGMFAACVARFGDDHQVALLRDAMNGYAPSGLLSCGNFKLFEAYLAKREHRALAARDAAIEAEKIFTECGHFPGRIEALEIAGETVRAAQLLRTAGAVAELARIEGAQLDAPERSIASLSLRERQIAKIFCAGATSRATADQLGIGQRTVETHIAKIYQKLGVRTRGDLAALLRRAQQTDLAT